MNKYFYAINRRISSLYISVFDQTFKNDKNFNNSDLEEFFVSNPSSYHDTKVFKDIFLYYEIASEIQKNSDYKYQVGNEWLPIYTKQMNAIKEILITKNFKFISKAYNNFFRERFSSGLHGDSGYERFKKRYLNSKISFINRNLYSKQCVYTFNLWKRLLRNIKLEELNIQSIGNENYYNFDGYNINPNYFKNHYYAKISLKLIEKSKKNKFVFELGGGYGNYAYFLNLEKDITYVGCDLPENISLTYFYLKSLLPYKKIKLVHDLNKEKIVLDEYDIVLISNYDIEYLPSDYFDLSFNSYSLAEMQTEAINNYIHHISRITKNYFFHVNHTKYSSFKSDNFKISLNKFSLVSKNESLWNKYTNKFSDEYEFIYKAI